ncbi:hypothetical protein H4R34_003937 [Dimargaris verticillata]|uniref:Tyrosine specific protein phosphatases domain-containing protein n=1 Tax=Dimargaris verticillata TaxID=2761393 RepID=A0A9W8EBK7_9FUNG|nr:hypothetical protein H4R34_003937 [Dimargaris verticillata]
MASSKSPQGVFYTFDKICNFRDVAHSVNDSLSRATFNDLKHPLVRENMLFRSARPDRASTKDVEEISDKLKIKTIVDLRSEIEGNEVEENVWYISFPLVEATALGGYLSDSGSSHHTTPNQSTESLADDSSVTSIPSGCPGYDQHSNGKKPRFSDRIPGALPKHNSKTLTLPSSPAPSNTTGLGSDLESFKICGSSSSQTSNHASIAEPLTNGTDAGESDIDSDKDLKLDRNYFSMPDLARDRRSSILRPNQQRYNINLIGSRFRHGFIWRSSSWTTRTKLAYFQLRGMKEELLDTVGREIFAGMGLAGFYKGLLCYSGKEIARVIKLFSKRANYPILVHCTHGKDRTGIVVALILSLLGVHDSLIVDDYAKTSIGLCGMADEIKRDMKGTGMPSSFAEAPPEAMASVLQHIHSTYGSTELYLELIGISKQRQRSIRNILLDE